MKTNRKLLIFFLLSSIVFGACEKEVGTYAPDAVTSKEYVYNTATKALSPDENISVQVSSDAGVKLIYSYLVRGNRPDSLIHIYFPPEEESRHDFTLSVPFSTHASADLAQITGVKLMVRRSDNTSQEAFVAIQSFTPPLPQWTNVPISLEPDGDNVVHVTATALSENGITRIELYDNYQGAFDKVHEVVLNGEAQYAFGYNYTYRPNTSHLRLVLYDEYGLQAEAVISVPVLPYDIHTDVRMSAQGTTSVTFTNSAIVLPAYELFGACDFPARDTEASFFFYNTGNGPTFYAPSNTGNVIRNYRCNGPNLSGHYGTTEYTGAQQWIATRFRVLDPTNTAENAVYTAYNTNNIEDLNDDGLFSGITAPSTGAPRLGTASGQFDTTTKYLVWAKIPNPGKTINVLMRIKNVEENGNEASITFDLLVPRD